MVLLTDALVRTHDAQRDAEAAARAREHWLGRLRLSVEAFNARRAAQSVLSDRDIIWSMFNEDLQGLMEMGDLHGLAVRYYGMALFVAEENRPFLPLLQQHSRMELMSFRKTGIGRVEILSTGAGSACEACYEQHGRVFLLSEALETMPLPCKRCATVVVGDRPGFCRCIYLAVME